MTSPTLAFLGIGLMGKPMATRLAQAGFTVRAWNRTHDKAAALRAVGADPQPELAGALDGADIVISMLESGAVVAQVIDAPVSGGVVGAEAGTLAIMAGGSVHDFALAEPVLRAMGRPTLVGPAGSGQVAKLCNQLIVGGTLDIVAEALLLAHAAGADPAAVRSAIRGGFAESRILEVHGQRMLERNFMPGGQVKSQLKDMQNVLVAAADAGIALPVTALVTEHYRAIAGDYPGADQSAALLALEKVNPGQRLGDAPDQLP